MNLETPNLQQKNNSGLELKKSRFIKKKLGTNSRHFLCLEKVNDEIPCFPGRVGTLSLQTRCFPKQCSA